MTITIVARIAVIHSTVASVAPFADALSAVLPTVKRRDVVDVSLLHDLAEDPVSRLTPTVTTRMERLLRYVAEDDLAAIQLACSDYGPVASQLAPSLDVPLLNSDDALYRTLVSSGYDRVGVVGTAPPVLGHAEEVIRRCACAAGRPVQVVTRSSRAREHPELEDDGVAEGPHAGVVRAAVSACADGAQAIALAQYTLAAAAPAVAAQCGVQVLTGPETAVRRLSRLLAQDAPSDPG